MLTESLSRAAWLGDASTLEAWFAGGGDANDVTKFGHTLLCSAVDEGRGDTAARAKTHGGSSRHRKVDLARAHDRRGHAELKDTNPPAGTLYVHAQGTW